MKNQLKQELIRRRDSLFDQWLMAESAQSDTSIPGPVRLRLRDEMSLISQELREIDSLFVAKTKGDPLSTRKKL